MANEQQKANSNTRKRPVGITLLAILFILLGALLIVYFTLTSDGIANFISGILLLYTAYGFFKLNRSAWYLGIVLLSLYLISFLDIPAFSYALITLILIGYLLSKKKYFVLDKPDVKKMEMERDIEGLIKALGYKNKGSIEEQWIRGYAASALGKIGDTRAIGPLIKVLDDPDTDVRMRVAEAMGKIGDERAMEPLIKALADPDADVRARVSEAMGKIGDKRAVEPLIEALGDYDADVRVRVTEALRKIVDEHSIEPLIKALDNHKQYVSESVSELLVKMGTPAVEPLVKALSYNTQEVPQVLGKIGAAAIEPLIKVLNDSDTSVRMNAAEILEKIGWEPSKDENGVKYWIAKGEYGKCAEIGILAVDPLIKKLDDSDSVIRLKAAEALGKIGWEPGKDENGVKYWIAKGEYGKCAEIGIPAVEPLIHALNYYDDNARLQAAMTLGKIDDESAVEPLIKALNDSDNGVRSSAAEALGKIGAPAVEPLIKALCDQEEYVYEGASEALIKIGRLAVEPLVKALKDSDQNVRKGAAEALGKIGDAAAVEPLIEALDDPNADVRVRVAEALRNFSNQTAVSALKEYDESQKKKKSHEYSLTNIISNITLIDARNLGNAGSGGAAFQAAIQKLNQQDYYGAERDFLNAISIGLDSLRQGYAYAEIGNIKLKQNDLNNAIRYFLKVFENGHVLYESADTASKYLSIIYSEMGRAEEAQIFTSIAAQTTGKLGYSLSPDAERRVRQLVRENN